MRPTRGVPFAAVGGAVTARTTAPAVRLSGEGLPTAIAVTAGAVARFEGVPAGRYAIAECDEPSCTDTTVETTIVVEPYRTRHVDLREASRSSASDP
jgi:hypothetical protein